MKRIYAITILLSFTMVACKSVSKYTDRGDYDAAIDHAVKLLEDRKNLNTKDVKAMEYAFKKMKSKEENDIKKKYNSKNADWGSIYNDIVFIDRLQKRIHPYLPIISKDGYKAYFSFINVGKLQEVALYEANQRDLQEIKHLTSNKDNNDLLNIYRLYDRITDRQSFVVSKPIIVGVEGYKPEFTFAEIADRKQKVKDKAVEVAYDKGVSYMTEARKGNKEYARKAYGQFRSVKSLNSQYKSVNSLFIEAEDLAIVHVLVELQNRSRTMIPRELEMHIINTNFGDLNEQWTKFYNDKNQRNSFDVTAAIELLELEISPEREQAVVERYEEEVKDGWEYVYDDKGNVKKDTSGNDIKVDRYVIVTGDWTTITRSKYSIIRGAVSYKNLATGSVKQSRPLDVNFSFEDLSYVFRGDERVLNKKMKRDLRKTILPFPSNFDITMSTGDILRNELKKELKRMVFIDTWYS